MKIPNADQAIIARSKIDNYLLNISHRRGGSKAKLLMSMGYSTDHGHVLEADIRSQHLPVDYDLEEVNEYGVCYIIIASLTGPTGRSETFRSIWQIDTGSVVPRLITMYPE